MSISKENFQKYSKWGIIGLAGLIAAPVIFLIIKGIVGLIVAAVVAGFAISVAPAATQWMANVKFKALEQVISRAPIETLITRAEERWKELNTQKELLKSQFTALEQFRMKTHQFIKKYPNERDVYLKRLNDHEQIVAFRVEKMKEAERLTVLFMEEVDKSEAVYDMAIADQAISKSLGKNQDFMAIFKEKTAFEAVEKLNSEAMASLKMALLDENYVAGKLQESGGFVHEVSYNPDNTMKIGGLLDVTDVAPLKIKSNR